MDQDIFVKDEQFDLSDPLNVQEYETIPSKIKEETNPMPVKSVSCQKIENEITKKPTKPSYICPFCEGSTFTKDSHLKRHIASVHERNKPYSCSLCDKSFSLNDNLQRHLNVHLANENSETVHEGNISLLLCSHCGMKFGRSDQLKRHIASVHERNTLVHKCSLCDYVGYTKNDLTSHVNRVHEQKKPHKCSSCDYSACSKGDLNKHFRRVHEKLKPDKCSICFKDYFSKSHLRIHIESVHEKKKPYLCTYCDTSFASNCGLQKHIFRAHDRKKSQQISTV